MKKSHSPQTKEVIEEIYDFAKDRLSDNSINPRSPADKWKQQGKAELLGELFHFLKELRTKYLND
jgi:hypothetical protein